MLLRHERALRGPLRRLRSDGRHEIQRWHFDSHEIRAVGRNMVSQFPIPTHNAQSTWLVTTPGTGGCTSSQQCAHDGPIHTKTASHRKSGSRHRYLHLCAPRNGHRSPDESTRPTLRTRASLHSAHRHDVCAHPSVDI